MLNCVLNINKDVIVWLVGWSFIGSTLGFFTLRNKPQWTWVERLSEYVKSVGVGIFFAFPTFVYLNEEKMFTPPLNLMIAGSLSFAITDAIIHIWPKFVEGIGNIFTKLIEKYIGIGKQDDNE